MGLSGCESYGTAYYYLWFLWLIPPAHSSDGNGVKSYNDKTVCNSVKVKILSNPLVGSIVFLGTNHAYHGDTCDRED